MEILRRNVTRIVLISTLSTLCVMWVVSRIQVRALEEELRAYGEERLKEFTRGKEGEPGLEVAVPVVTASKEYILFGKSIGKVALYMRRVDDEDSEGFDAVDEHGHAGGIGGVEFFLEREGEQWKEVESARCSSEQCRIEGKRAFESGSRLPSVR